ncbi:hypothetical protein SADUNF_Sadunf19G0095000 [Salix dunnii]|uniref:Uncharacterized protein n=1 Tax=Salix dunnii TaxID=1413687 RepID=A0A835J207_9ROSI|nr:hypothetical protein SADUNF_Sadunf19G0095000 [Salix dunnii]
MASYSNPPPPEQDFLTDDLPPLAQEMILNHTLNQQAKDKLFSLQDYLLLNYDSLNIHPKYLFIHLFTFKSSGLFPKELYFFFMIFPLITFFPAFLGLLGQRILGTILSNSSLGSTTPHNGPFKASTYNLVMTTFYKIYPYSLYEQPLTNLQELKTM